MDLRQRAIRHVVLKRNPFFECPRIEIRDKGFGHSLSRRILDSPKFQAGLLLVEAGAEKVLKAVAVAAGLSLGLALALILIGASSGIALYLLDPDLSLGVLAFLLRQNWKDYMGWALSAVSVFFLPYLLFGLPTSLTLGFYRPVHRFFARRRALRELRRENDNNDPALLKAQVAGYYYTEGRSRLSRAIERVLSVPGATVGALTSGIAGLSLPLLYLKFAALLFNMSVWVLVFAIFVTGGLGLILGFLTVYWFLRAFLGGSAISRLIECLFDGKSYFRALSEAVSVFIERVFEN